MPPVRNPKPPMMPVSKSHDSEREQTQLRILSQPSDLAALASQIRKREQLAGKDLLEHARLQGGDLIQVQEQVGSRKFAPWLRENIRALTERTASNYMRIAREWESIPETVSGIGEALAFLRLQTTEGDEEQSDGDTTKEPPEDKGKKKGGRPTPGSSPNHTKTFRLLVKQGDWDELNEMVSYLMKTFAVDNRSDAICEAVRRCYAGVPHE